MVLHALWLARLWFYGAGQPVQSGWLAAFLALQVARIWVLTTLGTRWTTRIIVSPSTLLVARGPYRFVAHPNYWVVGAGIAELPLCLDLPEIAITLNIINAAILSIRMRTRNAGLHRAMLNPA